MRMTVQGSFVEWLRSVSPPPLPIKRVDRKAMTQEEIKTAQHTERTIIDPVRINQFIDPAKEVTKRK